MKVFLKSLITFGGTFAAITICSNGNFIASVLYYVVAIVCNFLASVAELLVREIHLL